MPLVSLIFCTIRPWLLPAARATIERQTHPRREWIVVLHGLAGASLDAPQRAALEGARSVLEIPRARSLGHCLNAAIAEARGDIVAKIDDDDLYGAGYVAEAVAHLAAGDGDVVGKAEHFVYFARDGALVLRRPGASLRRALDVPSATLALPRALARQLPFADVNRGEGTRFLRDCQAANKRVFATSRRNFMYMRSGDPGDHTWTEGEDHLIATGHLVKRRPGASRAELLAMIETPAS